MSAPLQIIPLSPSSLIDIKLISRDINDIYYGLLESKHKLTTRKTYQSNLNQFASYLLTKTVVKGEMTTIPPILVKEVLEQYVKLDKISAIALFAEYQRALIEAGYLPNSINVKVASVKALVKYAYDFELCSFTLDKVKALPPEVYRNTKGTSVANMAKILALPDTLSDKGKRDCALLTLLWECGLRRAEICAVNWGDFDAKEGKMMVLGKGRISREAMALSEKAIASLLIWKETWGAGIKPSDPIFITLDRRAKGKNQRLTDKGVYKLVKTYSSSVAGGKVLSPHQIRHSAITAVLDATNGNVRMAQNLSRHKNTDTLLKYDDNRKAEQQKAVNLLSSLV